MQEDDTKWLGSTTNELNNLLQVIAESTHALEPLCTNSEEGRRYFDFLKSGLNRAISVTREMGTRLGGVRSNEGGTKTAKPSAIPVAPAPQIVNPEGTRELIMLVDDEEMVRTIVTTVLVRDGYRVVAVADPLRALDALRNLGDKLDLVILDFTLPIMDGSELFEEFRKIKPDITVMLSSGFAEQAKVRAMLAQGLRGFLPKPYTEAKLLEQVRSTLDAVRADKPSER